MSIRHRIRILYPSVMKRIRRWGLPCSLMILYLTAAGLTINVFPYRLPTFGLISLHRFAGFMTIIAMLAMLYDHIQHRLNRSKERTGHAIDGGGVYVSDTQRAAPYRWVNGCFYCLLAVAATLGVILHGLAQQYGSGLRFAETAVRWMHATGGWLLLSLIAVKYYLELTGWIRGMMVYLRSS
jgi:hypothetical protein